MFRKVIFLAVLAALVLALLPVGVSAAPPANPPVPNEFWMVAANWVRVYANEGCTALLTALRNDAQAGSYIQVLLNDPSGAVLVDYYTIDRSNGVAIVQGSGWLPLAAFGSSLTYMGTSLPVAVIAERGAEYIQPISNCQVWLECNGYSNAGTGPVWDWLDRSGIITTHPEDCIPYRDAPRPPGCYP